MVRKKELLNSKEIQELLGVRQIRNASVHTERRITGAEAESTLGVSDKIIAALDKVSDRCYICGNLYPLSSLEFDDITGASVCKACAKENPDWKDTFLTIGMDP